MGGCIGYEAPEKGIQIIECEKSQADRIICAHHYSHKVTQNSFVSLLVLYNGKVNGALLFVFGLDLVGCCYDAFHIL